MPINLENSEKHCALLCLTGLILIDNMLINPCICKDICQNVIKTANN